MWLSTHCRSSSSRHGQVRHTGQGRAGQGLGMHASASPCQLLLQGRQVFCRYCSYVPASNCCQVECLHREHIDGHLGLPVEVAGVSGPEALGVLHGPLVHALILGCEQHMRYGIGVCMLHADSHGGPRTCMCIASKSEPPHPWKRSRTCGPCPGRGPLAACQLRTQSEFPSVHRQQNMETR